MKQLLPVVVAISAWSAFASGASAQEPLTIDCDTRLACMEEFENKSIFEFLSPLIDSNGNRDPLTPRGDTNFKTFQGFVQERSLSAADLKVFKDGTFEGFIRTDRKLAQPDYLYTDITFNGRNDDPPGAVIETSVTSNNELVVRPIKYDQFGDETPTDDGNGAGDPEDLPDLGHGFEFDFPDDVVVCYGPCEAPPGEVTVWELPVGGEYSSGGMESTGGGDYSTGGGDYSTGGGDYSTGGGDYSTGGGYSPGGFSSSY